jgi:MFS family permease
MLYALPLLVYFYLGFWVRPLADDTCVAVKPAQVGGLLATVIYDYNHWFGRVSESLTSTIFASAGMPTITFAAPMVLTIWYVGLVWALFETARLLRMPGARAFAFGGAAVLLVGTLAGSPAIVQSLYWVNAIFTYAASVAVFPYVAALTLAAMRHEWRGWRLYGAALVNLALAFFAAAFSEPYAAVQFAALILALAAVFVFWRRKAAPVRVMLIAAIIGTVLAIIVILLAPGNAVRQTNFERSPVPTAALAALEHGAAFLVASTLSFSPLGALSALSAAGLLGFLLAPVMTVTRRQLRIGMIIAFIAGYLLISAFMFIGFFAASQPPPARAYIIPQAVWITTLGAIGFQAGWYISNWRQVNRIFVRVAGIVAVIVIVIAPLVLTNNALALLSPMTTYAREWEARDSLARQAAANGETQVVLPPYTMDLGARVGLESLTDDPSFWINTCAATYYGLESVIVAPD